MFVSGYEQFHQKEGTEITTLKRSPCGKFLAILLNRSIQIHDLYKKDLFLLSAIERNDDSLKEAGFNHWIEWISSNCITVGTQAGYIFIYSINIKGDLSFSKKVHLSQIITAHGTIFGALVLAYSGPTLQFFSPDGNLLSTINFPNAMSQIIRQMYVLDPQALVIFSDGRAALLSLKQQDIIEQKPISVEFLEMNDIASGMITAKNHLVLQTYSGNLIKISENKELTVVCEDSMLFQVVKDGSHYINISNGGKLNIWSSITQKNSSTKLDWLCMKNELSPGLMSSEMDLLGLRLYVASLCDIYIIEFSKTEFYHPSLVFHSTNEIRNFENNTTISIKEFFEPDEFPISSIAYSSKFRTYVMSVSNQFRLYHEDSKDWLTRDFESNISKTLWFQDDFYFTITFDYGNSIYRLIMLNNVDISQVVNIDLEGIFIDYDYFDRYIVVGTTRSITLFEIQDFKVKIVSSTKTIPSYNQVCLFHDSKTFAIVTQNKELLKYPEKEVLFEGVTYARMSCESNLLFFNAHRQSFVYAFNKLIRLEQNVDIIKGITSYQIPTEYDYKNFMFLQNTYLIEIIYNFLTEPEKAEEIIISYLSTTGISTCVAKTIEISLEKSTFDKFNEILDKFGAAKEKFLLVALFEVDPRYRDEIKSNLPPFDDLKTRYPNMISYLKSIYEPQV